MKKTKKTSRLNMPKIPSKVRLIATTFLAVAVIATGSLRGYRYLHRSDVRPNGKPPITGISLVFSPPLKHTAQLEIDDSYEKPLKTMNLIRANGQNSAHSISNPLGITYNVPLGEGVYRVKVTSSENDFPPLVSTVTVTNHTLTSVRLGFSAYP